jgi:acyl-CoA reductase-like NAD-dependent aldehyde dehydrogenase
VLIDASADLDLAATKLATAGYAYAGQSCISSQRVYVHQEVAGPFVEALVGKVAALRVGDPLDPGTEVGPLIRPEDRDRVKAWVEEAVEQGAKLRIGGEVNPDGTLQPAVLDDVTGDMKVSREEVFGPVLAVQTVADMAEAVALANDSRYGLNAGIFTSDYDSAMLAVRKLHFGAVLVNEVPTFRADQMPYGGVRESGNTREGPAYAIHDYLERKLVVLS